jgi:hypothetical protein
VRHVGVRSGTVDFPASVDFSANRTLEAPNTVENAPRIARDQDGDGRVDLGTETAATFAAA